MKKTSKKRKITHREFQRAVGVIKMYREENSGVVKPYRCLFCQQHDVIPGEQMDIEQQEKHIWVDGIVGKITASYGSKFDGASYLLGLCDSCIEGLIKMKLIINANEFKLIFP